MKKSFFTLLLLVNISLVWADDLTFSVTNTVAGFSSGAIDMSVSGGVAPYTYTWSGPSGFSASTEDISGLATGTYTVTVTDLYCGVATTTVFVDASTEIAETSNNFSFTVFPNPANEQVTVYSEKPMNAATITLVGLDGKVLLSKTGVTGTSAELNIANLSKGLYFMEINNQGDISRKRLLKD